MLSNTLTIQALSMWKQARVKKILEGGTDGDRKRKSSRRGSRESLDMVNYETGDKVREKYPLFI